MAKKAIKVQQSNDPNSCGFVNPAAVKTSPIFISPVCDPLAVGNEHRANARNQLSYNVIHESRHAWHMSERAAAAGANSDGDSATPRNDDDADLLIEVVSFPSGRILLESTSGTNDATFDPDPAYPSRGYGFVVSEIDAQTFGVANKNTCP